MAALNVLDHRAAGNPRGRPSRKSQDAAMGYGAGLTPRLTPPIGLPERIRANAAALDALVASGNLSRRLLRALAEDLHDFAAEAGRYDEARVLLGEMPR